MSIINLRRISKYASVAGLMVFLVTGCGTLDVGVAGTPTPAGVAPPTATGTPPSTVTPSATATVTPSPTATATVTPTSTPAITMDATPPPGLIYQTGDGLWRIDTDQEAVPLFDTTDARLSPDGEYVVYQTSNEPSQQNLWVANRHTDERRPLIAAEGRLSCCASWWPARPDTVIVSSWPEGIDRGMGGDLLVGFLTAVDVETGEHRVLDQEHDTFGTAAPSPDGRLIAYGSGRVGWLYDWQADRVEVFDPADYDLPDDFAVSDVVRPAWSPDGDKLAWYLHGTHNGQNTVAVGVFDRETKSATLLHPHAPIGTDGWPPPPRFSPDDDWIAFTAWHQNRDDSGVWVARVDGEDERMLVQAGAYDTGAPVWRPHGEFLAVSRLADEETPATTWTFAADTWQRQELDMPAEDATVVDWWISGAAE